MEEKIRCDWCVGDPLYEAYHDLEWGVPLKEDDAIFEFLTLETFQAGLSWITVLRKRENFRKAFDNFDYRKISEYSEEKIEALMEDSGIIRNRLKILAAVSNSLAFMQIQQEFESFSNYIWGFVDQEPVQNRWGNLGEVPATTATSDALSKDLKKRGFKFVGSTVIYAHMQATGMVNDHITGCFRHQEVKNLNKSK